jgi:high-affinity iron transporter
MSSLGRLQIRLAVCWLLLGALAPAARAAGSADPQRTADIRRVLTLLNVVGEEYREGVADGAVVLPVEYDEARMFLDEAQSRLKTAGLADLEGLSGSFDSIRAAIVGKRPLDEVRPAIDGLRARISELTGVKEVVFPPAPPSASRGSRLFSENCVPCHGAAADGRGENAADLKPPPANFTDGAFMRAETPFDFFHVISVGKGKSAMPAWGEVFSVQERWDLIAYLWSVRHGADELAEGQGVYLAHCAGCHGQAGDGKGAYSSGLLEPVPVLDEPEPLARKSDRDLFAAVADGVSGTPMPGFSHSLSEDQIWAAVAFTRLLSLGGPRTAAAAAAPDPGAAARRFAGALRLLGEEYGKAVRPGQPVDENELTESTILLDQLLGRKEAALDAVSERYPQVAEKVRGQVGEIERGVRGREDSATIAALATAAAKEIEARFPEAAEQPGAAKTDALAETKRLLGDAVAAYRDGNPRAVYTVSDAYFQFEPLEKRLALIDPDITRRVEEKFVSLRAAAAASGNDDRVAALVAEIGTDLDAARRALRPRQAESRWSLAFQSATIILREGFEVVLIIGALLAYAVKSGNERMKRPILLGTAAGIAGSLATAYVLARLVLASGVAVEALEGATMLLAAAVLFFVSYWLISKAEADKWQRYIQGKVKTAVVRGSGLALASAAFLAVYREGVETTLFYDALAASAPGELGAVVGGFAVGLVALALVYLIFARFGMRIPIRQFFFGTSVLLYYLAFVFAGKGVVELQETGWIGVTHVAGVPRIDFLGIHPTLESLLVQGILLACLLYAVWVALRRRRSSTEGAVVAEVRQLRELAAEIRREIAQEERRQPGGARQAGQRLDTLIARVSELEEQMAPKLASRGGAKA